jgi:hypothetical protein
MERGRRRIVRTPPGPRQAGRDGSADSAMDSPRSGGQIAPRGARAFQRGGLDAVAAVGSRGTRPVVPVRHGSAPDPAKYSGRGASERPAASGAPPIPEECIRAATRPHFVARAAANSGQSASGRRLDRTSSPGPPPTPDRVHPGGDSIALRHRDGAAGGLVKSHDRLHYAGMNDFGRSPTLCRS